MGYIDETWYVGNDGHKYYPIWSVITECAYLIPQLHICSDRLITKRNQISRSSGWASLMKLGMWAVMGTSTIHVGCHYQCAYLIPHLHICSNWLITKNKICNN